MDIGTKDIYLIAYFLSKYDLKGVQDLGYKTRNEAFKTISNLLGNDNHSLKLRRDEFDVVTDSSRIGFVNRKPRKYVLDTAEECSKYSYEELLFKIKNIIKESKEIQYNNHISDFLYVKELDNYIKTNKGEKTFRNKPKLLQNKTYTTRDSYKRSLKVAANALMNADYKCEICSEHKTFIRKRNLLPYTEPHHLIPIENQKIFKYDIDVENNIVSLCSNCHNKLHYGIDVINDLHKLYMSRKQLLTDVGINITFEELLKMYD